MYKTTWHIKTEEFETELTWYHFGKKTKVSNLVYERGYRLRN